MLVDGLLEHAHRIRLATDAGERIALIEDGKRRCLAGRACGAEIVERGLRFVAALMDVGALHEQARIIGRGLQIGIDALHGACLLRGVSGSQRDGEQALHRGVVGLLFGGF